MSFYQRRRETVARMRDPKTADNIEVRLRLVEQVKSGEITLKEAQKKLEGIKRSAKKNGIPTAYGGY